MHTVVQQDGSSVRLSVSPVAIPTLSARPRRPARRELAALCESWKQTQAEGGGIVEILGASGSGKSRLLAAFAERFSEEPARFLKVDCRERDMQPFSALGSMFDDHLQRIEGSPESERVARKAALRTAAGPLAANVATLSPRLAELFRDAKVQLEEADAQRVFVESCVEFLVRYLDAVGPSVCAIDDAHQLDSGSGVVLCSTARRLKAGDHLLVYAARDDVAQRKNVDLLRAQLPSARLTSLQLAGLTSDELAELVSDELGAEIAPESELVQKLSLLSDGTPLGARELLRLSLEHGYLTQQDGCWVLDAAIHAMQLPAVAREYIGLRVSQLAALSTLVLRAAALLGGPLQGPLLAIASGLELDEVECALKEGVDARLLQLASSGAYEFVHDSVSEILLRGLPLPERRREHSEVAARLHAAAREDVEYAYLLARQYAAGDLARDPTRAFAALRRAASLALKVYDDRLALSFLRPAEEAARLAGIQPQRDFYIDLAETSLRSGDVRASRSYFEQALARSAAGLERAQVFSRLAWLQHFDSDADACWRTLRAGLAECGCAAPSQGHASLVAGAVRVLAGSARRRWLFSQRDGLETVCALYVASIRLLLESRDGARSSSRPWQLAAAATRLPACRSRVEAELMLAVVQAAKGALAKAERTYREAEAMAERLADPIAQTSCHRIRHVIDGWQGDFDACEREAVLCHKSSHWMELGEFCHLCLGMYALESARGRLVLAFSWVERALDRIHGVGRAPAILRVLEQAAYGTLAAMRRDAEADALRRRFQGVERAELQAGHYFHLLSFQPRVQRLVARGNLGSEFEALVNQFDRLVKPEGLHRVLAGHYVHVAHARVEQCLLAPSAELAGALKKLDRAVHCVRVTTGSEDSSPHLAFVLAAQAWFNGSHESARRHLGEAGRLAEVLVCPWVSCASARLRAHMLRAEGAPDSAADQARIAALLARQYAQNALLREICREFDLPIPADDYSGAFALG